MKKEIKKPIFEKGNDFKFNACVGRNGGPYNYYHYAKSYFNAGHIVSEYILKNDDSTIDLLIYPILYNYRHGIELSLKDILNINNNLIGIHDLIKIYEKTKPYILKVLKNKKDLEKIHIQIKKFNKLDPRAEATRFPENKKGEMFWQNIKIINIEPIYKNMKELQEMFSFIRYELKEMQELKNNI